MSDDPIKPDPERKPKRPADANQRAKMVVDLATGEAKSQQPGITQGQAGGLKGGKARASKMTPEQRSLIAKRAANARWKSQDSD